MPVRRVLNSRVPVKVWTDDVEDVAAEQLKRTGALPFVFKHVAAMADTHWGLGATVGSVIATKGAVCPAAVGVDIGCGMAAVKTSLPASALEGAGKLSRLRIDGHHAFEQLQPVDARHPHVRHDHDGRAGRDVRERVGGRRERVDREPGERDGLLDADPDVFIVLDDQHANLIFHALSFAASPPRIRY